MAMVKEDILWLEPLVFDNNYTIIEATFDYEIKSTSLTMSTLTVTSSSAATPVQRENHFFVLTWSVRIIGGLLIVIGGIGNTLSALTLSRKKLRAQVTSIYLIALALSDLGKQIYNYEFDIVTKNFSL